MRWISRLAERIITLSRSLDVRNTMFSIFRLYIHKDDRNIFKENFSF
jgi:hypothetical protein